MKEPKSVYASLSISTSRVGRVEFTSDLVRIDHNIRGVAQCLPNRLLKNPLLYGF